MDKKGIRVRGWVFTVFKNIDLVQEKLKSQKNFPKYIIVGTEMTKDLKKHLQGYVYFKNGKTMSATKKWIGEDSTHLEVQKGTTAQNIKYCSKEGEVWSCGEPPMQGKRNDIEVAKEALENGANMRDILQMCRSNQVIQFAQKWLTYNERGREDKTHVIWCHGKTGTGKSMYARSACPNAYWCTSDNKWWDGYDAHKTVIIDDMRRQFCTYAELLRLLDRYPLKVAVKGAFRSMVAVRIIITSSKSPKQMFWDIDGDNIDQLTRRIDEIKNFDDPDEALANHPDMCTCGSAHGCDCDVTGSDIE